MNRPSAADAQIWRARPTSSGGLAKLRFPVFATSVRADCVRLSDLPGGTSIAFDFESPIEVGGMHVWTGVVVVADGDGVMTFAREHLEDVVEAAVELVNGEGRFLALLDAGATVEDVLRAASAES